MSLEVSGKEVTHESLRQEIRSLQKVVTLQQDENRQLQETVNLLETELDDSRILYEKLQKQLNSSNDIIFERDGKINQLEEELKAAKIESKSFEKFSSQNKMLLDKLLREQKDAVAARSEAERIGRDADSMKAAIENRSKCMTEKEIEYTTELRKLKEKLALEKKLVLELRSVVNDQSNTIAQYRTSMQTQSELKSDEIARSRQTEYKTLLKAEMALLELQKFKDDNEMIVDTLHLSANHTNILKSRLADALKKADDSNEMLHSFVSKAEESSSMAKVLERRLRKENEILQQRVVSLKLTLRDMTEHNQFLERKVDSLTRVDKWSSKKRNGGSAYLDYETSSVSLPQAVSLRKNANSGFRSRGILSDELSVRTRLREDTSISETSESVIHPFDCVDGSQNGLTLGEDTAPHTSSSALASEDESLTRIEHQTSHSVQYQGKKCLLAKYMRCIASINNTVTVPQSLKYDAIDFSRCALTDDDVLQLVDWFRLMPVNDIKLIDFRSNLLTIKAASYLATWLLSLTSSDLMDRVHPMHINCQYNMISSQSIPNIVAQFLRTPQPDIKLVDTECDGQVIVVYGNRLKSGRNEAAIVRWNFENNYNPESSSEAK
mmetsp:Transcript_5182/g.7946  ORF Transcript_5182/g.7946 Transcript_5182/m.7946 type:complete len:608 (+) Transcript_5182:87-1910(+)